MKRLLMAAVCSLILAGCSGQGPEATTAAETVLAAEKSESTEAAVSTQTGESTEAETAEETEKLVEFGSMYFTDDDSEIKPGKAVSKYFASGADFDRVEFYLTGYRDKQ